MILDGLCTLLAIFLALCIVLAIIFAIFEESLFIPGKIKTGDEIIFPTGDLEDSKRYRVINGKVIRIRGIIYKKYAVLYMENDIEKIEEFSKVQIYPKNSELIKMWEGSIKK